jgi:Leucine-rich repeat (LRR) protein
MKNSHITIISIIFLLLSCRDMEELPKIPEPPITNGGRDFLDVGEFNVKLDADELKPNHDGTWKIFSGMIDNKVLFEDIKDPKTIFRGLPGETYKLLWEIKNGLKSTTDTVIVKFLPLKTEITVNQAEYWQTRIELQGKSYDRGKWTIEGDYHHIYGPSGGGLYLPDDERPAIKFYGNENSTCKITWTTWYGSKSASATYEYKSGEYHQDEALEDLSILYSQNYYKKNEKGDVVELDLGGDSRGNKFNYIKDYPSFKAFKYLKKLNLHGDGIHTFPEVILSNYLDLNYLNISHNYFKTLPENFGDLIELDTLILSNNIYFEKLPDSFGELKKLRFLELSSLNIKSLPESFSNLSEVIYLNLEQNDIDKLPENIGNLRNMKTFRGPKLLQSVPNSFSNLTNLEFCFFTVKSGIAKLPEDIGRLTELKTLWLYGNYQSLPTSFSKLINLTDFVAINGAGITSMPENFGDLINLTKIQMTVKLKELPNSFSKLVNLKYLSIHGELNYLTSDIGNLTNLEEFGASYVKLKELPESIGNLKNIKVLIFAGNELTSIPSSIGDLTKIKELNFSRNKINTFPSSIFKLSNTLQHLVINGNPYSEDELNLLKLNLPNTTIITYLPGD